MTSNESFRSSAPTGNLSPSEDDSLSNSLDLSMFYSGAMVQFQQDCLRGMPCICAVSALRPLQHNHRRFGTATEPEREPVADTGRSVELGLSVSIMSPEVVGWIGCFEH